MSSEFRIADLWNWCTVFYFSFRIAYTCMHTTHKVTLGLFNDAFSHEGTLPASTWEGWVKPLKCQPRFERGTFNISVSHGGEYSQKTVIFRSLSSGILCHVVWWKLTDVSEVLTAQGNDGGSKHLWTIGQFLPDYMSRYPRRQISLFPDLFTVAFYCHRCECLCTDNNKCYSPFRFEYVAFEHRTQFHRDFSRFVYLLWSKTVKSYT
jgi:hypothetical protein